jgi:hypothetical protein
MNSLSKNTTYVRALLLGFALVSPSAKFAYSQHPIAIEVRETAGIRRFQYPVAAQLQLKAPVSNETNFRLLLDNQPVLAQFRPAEQGAASAGWFVDFPVNLLPYQSLVYAVEYGPQVAEGPSRKGGHRLVESAESFQVVNEPAIAWTVDRKLAGLLKSVRARDLEYLRPDSAGLWLTDGNGSDLPMGSGRDDCRISARVVRNGPLAVGIRFELIEQNPALQGVRSTIDLVFPVFKSWVEVDWRVDDPQQRIARLGAQLDLNLNEPTRSLPTLVDFGATSLVYVSLRPGQTTLLRGGPMSAGLPQRDGKERVAWEVLRGSTDGLQPFVAGPRGSQVVHLHRPEGWAHVMDRERCLALAVDRFAGDAKDQISASAAGRVRLSREFSDVSKASPAKAKRLRFWLHLVPFPPQQTAATSPQSMQDPPVVRVRPGPDQ